MTGKSIKILDKSTVPAKPRATFSAASFGNLRSATGEGQGEPLRLLLADIDEDPDQPRQTFDSAELESMAQSIKEHGVVQPIIVVRLPNGRYMLAFGARRLRASKLAGMRDIPATVRDSSENRFAAQIIENQQRANLSNKDLATAIERLAKDGLTVKKIGAICALREYQVAAFRQAPNFPPELSVRLDNADMRALYDLFRQWGKTPAEVISALPDVETYITVTEARRIIGSITGKPTGSIILDQAKVVQQDVKSVSATGPQTALPMHELATEKDAPPVKEAPPLADSLSASKFTLDQQEKGGSEIFQVSSHESHSASRPAVPQAVRPLQANFEAVTQAQRTKVNAPVFVVSLGDGQPGRLITDRRATQEGAALIEYPTGIEEVDASELRILRVE